MLSIKFCQVPVGRRILCPDLELLCLSCVDVMETREKPSASLCHGGYFIFRLIGIRQECGAKVPVPVFVNVREKVFGV